jgi:hypothetical protein
MRIAVAVVVMPEVTVAPIADGAAGNGGVGAGAGTGTSVAAQRSAWIV